MAIDIDQSHYNTGTATVAGTAVTGQGTAWLGAVRKGDLFGTHKGSGVRIASVDSNTSLTLAYAVTGLEQVAAVYEIQRTPYDVGYLAAIEDMIRLYGVGNLPSLAALDGTGGDKGVMLTGAGTGDTFDLTEKARALLGRASGALMYGDLGEIPREQLPARLRDLNATIQDDCNALALGGGWYVAGPAAANSPGAGNYWYVWRDKYSFDWMRERAYSIFSAGAANTHAMVRWRRDGTTWDPWEPELSSVTELDARYRLAASFAYDRSNILGTVSQVGGVPSDALIEDVYFNGGRYIRWANGTQICTYDYPGNLAAAIAPGAAFTTGNFSFLAAFTGAPYISYSGYVTDGNGAIFGLPIADATAAIGGANTQFKAAIHNTQTISTTTVIGFKMFSIGRWF